MEAILQQTTIAPKYEKGAKVFFIGSLSNFRPDFTVLSGIVESVHFEIRGVMDERGLVVHPVKIKYILNHETNPDYTSINISERKVNTDREVVEKILDEEGC